MHKFLSQFSSYTKDNAIDKYMSGIEVPKDSILFSIGLPNQQLLPKKEFQIAIEHFFSSNDRSLFNYCDSKGLPQLVSTISNLEKTSMENIMVTSGNTQGFELAMRLLLDPNDIIAFEEYTYSLVHSAVHQYQVKPLAIPIEADGLDVTYLERTLKTNPIKLLYTIPNAQNPTGVTLSLEKRKKLIELSYKYGFIILEDDPYRDLLFLERLPSLFELDASKERVIYLYSFSKTIAPTLRTGYLLANPLFISKLEQFKQTMDSCTSPLNQFIVNHILSSGNWNSMLNEQRSFYESKKLLTKEFLCTMKDKYGWNSLEPSGGLFYWIDIRNGDSIDFLRISAKNGAIFIPGNAFSLDGPNKKIRLCYSFCSDEELLIGFDRLDQSFKEYTHSIIL